MSRVTVVGAGVVGLLSAWNLARRGHEVAVVERSGPGRDGCSSGNAGMIVPSHFVPLAAPGMIRLGLKWLGNPESPFALAPRLSQADLERAGTRFHCGTDVTGFARDGGSFRGVRTTARDIPTDEIVLCAGVWSSAVAAGSRPRDPREDRQGLQPQPRAPGTAATALRDPRRGPGGDHADRRGSPLRRQEPAPEYATGRSRERSVHAGAIRK